MDDGLVLTDPSKIEPLHPFASRVTVVRRSRSG